MHIDCIGTVVSSGFVLRHIRLTTALNMPCHASTAFRVRRPMPRPDVVVGSSVRLTTVAAAVVIGKTGQAVSEAPDIALPALRGRSTDRYDLRFYEYHSMTALAGRFLGAIARARQ